MKIAVLSGKGGTGKTFVSVNLTSALKNSTYVDCDVEEPNGQIFFSGKIVERNVDIDIPVIDNDKCFLCGKCSEFCKFNALALILDKVRVFSSLCHSCGGCKIVCPTGAIKEKKKTIGKIQELNYLNHHIISGVLNVGEESGVKVINEALLTASRDSNHIIIDCPPGNGCSVMESIREVDYCVLVSEPTVFGLHNLEMVYELTQVFGKKVGLVINKANDEKIINEYARNKNIDILTEIPFNREIGYLNSQGIIVEETTNYKSYFETILAKILGEKS